MDAIARLVLVAFGCFLVVLSKDKRFPPVQDPQRVQQSSECERICRCEAGGVGPINFVSKKESFCLFDVRQVETTIHFIPFHNALQ